ncbi:hypothetical protein KR054_008087 [Drosophila jambulina]|nr:hypothetical protein KR054_008087 [Drosophila jambulina]
MTNYWLTLLAALFLGASTNWALEIPSHNCSHFTYRQLPSGQWIGLIEAPFAGILKFDWKVSFITNVANQDSIRFLEHFPSEEENLANIRKGGKAQVFAALQESENTLPALHILMLNNAVLCWDHKCESETAFFLFITMCVYIFQILLLRAEIFAVLSWVVQQPQVQTDFEKCGQEGFVAAQHGGDLVTRGQYPWLAALLEGNSSITYKCVVSVISKRTVITAAHCIYGKPASLLWVYLGRHDRNQKVEDGAELVGVSNVLTPPEYSGNPLPDLDVGLLVLKYPIWYTRYIKPLCLWSTELPVPAREGDTGSVAGWGYDESGLKTRYPKAVSVRLVPRDQCLKRMERMEDFITERTVCAGNSESQGPCFGDSGAALIVLRNNSWAIRGIVSLSPFKGENCDLSSYAIYCDVSQHLHWIEQNIVR